MNADIKPNGLEGIGVLTETESMLEPGLTLLKDTETWSWMLRDAKLQVYFLFEHFTLL